MMQYFMKIEKFGIVLITYIVYGVSPALAGVGFLRWFLGVLLR